MAALEILQFQEIPEPALTLGPREIREKRVRQKKREDGNILESPTLAARQSEKVKKGRVGTCKCWNFHGLGDWGILDKSSEILII